MPAPYFNGLVRPTIAATTVAALRAYVSNLFVEAMIARISAVGLFEWAPLSIVADDGATVIIPNDIIHPAPGRWVLISFAAGALVGQVTNGEVKQTGATAGQIFTSGAPTAGGAWSADVRLLAGGITSPGNKAWDLGTNTVTHGAAIWTPGADALKLTGRGFWLDGNTGATPAAGAGTRAMVIPGKGMAVRFGSVTGALWDDANVGVGSFACGVDTQASGIYSFSDGSSCRSSGDYSVTMGLYCVADQEAAVAFGRSAYATLCGQFAESGYSITGGTGASQRTRTGLIYTSIDAGSVELTLNGTAPGVGVVYTITSGKAYYARIHLVCLCIAGTNAGKVASWDIGATFKNIGGISSVVGLPHVLRDGAVSVPINVAATPTTCDIALAAATAQVTVVDATDKLKIDCIGIVGGVANHFDWNATVYATEVK